jgi:DNA-binding response OmpR family regulator
MERTATRFRANVKVVMADGDTYMCQGLRNALTNEGYRDVRTVGRLSALRDVLAAAMADLLVLDADLADGDAIALVREIRRGKAGRNPFLPIILLIWTTDPEVVQRAVGSGVDLILIKPLSPAQLFSRIDGLVEDRKPFVVTADYMGPDRRDSEKPRDAEFYDVPNTLKDKIEGRPVDTAALSEQIDAALQEMNGSRLAQAGVKLAAMVDGICRAFEARRVSDETAAELAQVCYMAKSIAGLGGADLGKLCKSLIKIVRTMRNDLDAVDTKQIELLRPLSHSILLAANPKLALHPMMDEITRAVSTFVPKKRSEAAEDQKPAPVRG